MYQKTKFLFLKVIYQDMINFNEITGVNKILLRFYRKQQQILGH